MNKELVLRELDALYELASTQEHNAHEANGIYRALFAVEQMPDTETWIPVTERLPENGQKVWVTNEYRGGDRRVDKSIFRGKEFTVVSYPEVVFTDLVRAWVPRFVPEPYQEGS